MDKERRKKIQTTKLIITEIFMLVIIIVTVVVLTFVVMGYRLNEDGKLEQSGLIGVDSIPTGAKVAINGEFYENKTNTSKILPEGNYEILVEKDGYTSWKKTVSVHSGLLTKLSYPRLYKTDRQPETVTKFETAPSIFSISPLRNTILVSFDDPAKFQLLNLDSAELKSATLDYKKLLASATDLKILSWNKNGERVIASFTLDNVTHYAILDLERPEYSLDLTATFNVDFSELRFLNDNGDQLFALENGNLHTISLSDKKLSDPLVKNIQSYTSFGAKAALVTAEKKVLLYDYTAKSTLTLAKSSAEHIRALISEYLGRFTFALLEDNHLAIYRSDLPSENQTASAPVGEATLGFSSIDTLSTTAKEQAILASSGPDFTVFDLETYGFSNFTTESDLTFWPEDYTIGVTADGQLVFRDFDGLNRQVLSPAEPGFPAVITKDNKYLYFVVKNNQSELTLSREIIK